MNRAAGELLRLLVCGLIVAVSAVVIYLAGPEASCETDAECAAAYGEAPPAPTSWARGVDRSAP